MTLLQTVVLALALSNSNGGETVLLDFCADWCGPCRQMAPVVDQLAAKGYPVRRVNIDQDRALASRFGIQSIPCFVMVVDGREVRRIVGGASLGELEQLCLLARQGTAGAQQPAAGLMTTAPAPGHTPLLLPPASSGPATAVLAGSAASDAQLIAATVRLRIEDSAGHSCGSGTIIDARGGEALILTCGHLFRDSQGKGRIEVDLMGTSPAQGIPGRLLDYDLERDIALLSIQAPVAVTAARAAPAGYRVSAGDPVINVGCNNGEPPTTRRSRVTSLDKYLGPPNIQVSGQPVQGRSGGGLFSADGLLIGVCNAADPQDNEGFYAALGAIQAKLDDLGLAFVYQSGSPAPAAQAPLVAVDLPSMPKQMPRPSALLQVSVPPSSASTAAPPTDPSGVTLTEYEQAALQDLAKKTAQGDQVICIVRPRSSGATKSEIFVLENVSPGFLQQLGRNESAGSQQLTSLELPPPPPLNAAGPSGDPQSLGAIAPGSSPFPAGNALQWQLPVQNQPTVLR